jgi:hypothetical protein
MTMTAIEQLQQCEAEMGKPAFLEMMLHQQRYWVVEDHPDSHARVGWLRQRVVDLKAELGVTDEAAFLAARGTP